MWSSWPSLMHRRRSSAPSSGWGSITQKFDPNMPAGFVLSQSPQSGANVSINSVVNLLIPRGPQYEVAIELVAGGLTAPVGLVSPEDGSKRLFIVDQTGLIRILTNDGSVLTRNFLDIRSKMGALTESYDERGLIGLAFHPESIGDIACGGGLIPATPAFLPLSSPMP